MIIRKTLLTMTTLACLAGAAHAADPAPAAQTTAPAPGTPGAMAGMHGPHGMGKGMSMSCPMMQDKMMKHRHHSAQKIMMPRLPPGNEKLQLLMHAEILQKVGEIEAKYAAQLP